MGVCPELLLKIDKKIPVVCAHFSSQYITIKYIYIIFSICRTQYSYSFSGPLQKEAIEQGIRDIEEHTCIKFRYREPQDTVFVNLTVCIFNSLLWNSMDKKKKFIQKYVQGNE